MNRTTITSKQFNQIRNQANETLEDPENDYYPSAFHYEYAKENSSLPIGKSKYFEFEGVIYQSSPNGCYSFTVEELMNSDNEWLKSLLVGVLGIEA